MLRNMTTHRSFYRTVPGIPGRIVGASEAYTRVKVAVNARWFTGETGCGTGFQMRTVRGFVEPKCRGLHARLAGMITSPGVHVSEGRVLLSMVSLRTPDRGSWMLQHPPGHTPDGLRLGGCGLTAAWSVVIMPPMGNQGLESAGSSAIRQVLRLCGHE